MPKRKASAASKLKAVLKGLFCIDRADLDKAYLWRNRPPKPHKPPTDGDSSIGEEHAGLVADNEDEESEALFW